MYYFIFGVSSCRLQWNNERMISAMAEVKKGRSIREAADMFKVPRSTLHIRVTGRVVHGSKPGPKATLR